MTDPDLALTHTHSISPTASFFSSPLLSSPPPRGGLLSLHPIWLQPPAGDGSRQQQQLGAGESESRCLEPPGVQGLLS